MVSIKFLEEDKVILSTKLRRKESQDRKWDVKVGEKEIL